MGFGFPYTKATKTEPGINFKEEKAQLEIYKKLSLAVELILYFENDLYKNAVVPIASAHRYTAISVRPSGRVLELLTKQTLETP